MERANFFVHFVGWGGEKRRLAPGGILCLVADFWADSELCSLVSFCCLCRDLGVFLILLLWGFPRGFGEGTPFRRLLEGVAGVRNGEVWGNLEAGASCFKGFWGVWRGRMENYREILGRKTGLRLCANVLVF